MNQGLPIDDREGFAAFLLRLRGRGTVPKALIAAFEATPRRGFLAAQFHQIAWSDRMLPIECGEAIEGADMQAAVIAALAIEQGNRVLEIGTGSGYTSAVMSRLAARVITTDRYKTLAEQARQRFEALGIGNVIVRHADGSGGLPNEGPFDRIVAWASFDSLPRFLLDQLSSGGIVIAPIGPEEGEQVLAKLTKVGSRFEREDIGLVRLQPILRGVAAII
ncbi:protein-L-isoaspartate(D-aspartate) O-methyltransferase [Mesorhizobium sp. M7A.T.Ca.TU.009.01.3.2]|jgi:protein-L-isoaspartate(D-aspartate) O-methyltransferase|uniref:protein-L-isoaspartate(D-aspartate) O-methyltransferase n=2 Tax=Mesorhizobium TaxID=68287 RepID=UPI000FCAC745|nr:MULTISPECIES: protein-L-isoaspartate(D-aspartate) O-methyltransferase [unclassified Mesorhizobium]RUU08399.1 protein-L-isoaspartate(D-aspartate) O-methyltransferase [Mesorhizobium sp. M7A.T.Ca.TU.009.01.3.2]AZV21701.1 protein-L-isoaspartate(D-aspartate) O-methyltransferase [Mesorhizobium sp. M7A.F.Ce.TU.012.03.2.1]RUV37822.1 protein-L-isoaspartate(D-aspartate) O-methyltransferase [Mesorhizobium sp. M7A.F.Ca.MR.148.00.0.0]RWN09381.1 MAG: protein-L-isoaspartate(D-aspartate) O-methyltransferase